MALAAAMVGHLRGGLGQVNIVAATLFGGVSGSAVADASAVGGVMIPQMKARGYAPEYAVNITANAALIDLLIPPSHNMILYVIAAGGAISVADLFTAGIIPGLVMMLTLMVVAWLVASSAATRGRPSPAGSPCSAGLRRHSRPDADRHHLRRRPQRHLHRDGNRLRRGIYALLVTVLVYRSLGWPASAKRWAARCGRRGWSC